MSEKIKTRVPLDVNFLSENEESTTLKSLKEQNRLLSEAVSALNEENRMLHEIIDGLRDEVDRLYRKQDEDARQILDFYEEGDYEKGE